MMRGKKITAVEKREVNLVSGPSDFFLTRVLAVLGVCLAEVVTRGWQNSVTKANLIILGVKKI